MLSLLGRASNIGGSTLNTDGSEKVNDLLLKSPAQSQIE